MGPVGGGAGGIGGGQHFGGAITADRAAIAAIQHGQVDAAAQLEAARVVIGRLEQ